MKRLIAILMCLAMLLSLAACGQGENGETGKTNTPTVEVAAPDAEPTDEEWGMISECSEIIRMLDEYAETGAFPTSFVKKIDPKYDHVWETDGQQCAMAYCYERLQALSAVDKWVGSQWAADNNITWSRTDTLANFTVLEDVFVRALELRTDAFGQPLEDGTYGGKSAKIYVEYDAEGRIVQSYGGDAFYLHRNDSRYIGSDGKNEYNCLFDYDDNGIIQKISTGTFTSETKEIKYMLTPTYDADGKISSCTLIDGGGNQGSIEYTYNDLDQLTKVVSSISSSSQYGTRNDEYVWEYTYDSNGNLLKEVCKADPHVLAEATYTYDANNLLIAAEDIYLGEVSTSYTYTYDDAGRLLTCKGTGNGENRDVEYIYGSYYIYNPAE